MARRPAQTVPGKGWKDLLDVPEGMTGEIVDGTVMMTPRPGTPHAMAQGNLFALLQHPFGWGHGGPGGWVILLEPRVRFDKRNIRVPDLAAWKADRFVYKKRGPIDVLPDWICEVLSPGNALRDRTRKVPFYARHRIPHLWLVDPLARTLEVYRFQGEVWSVIGLHGGDDKVHAEPFDACELELSSVWGLVLPDEEEDEG
jgi:Uma2 family endonuclease